jgi:hypothetical protein
MFKFVKHFFCASQPASRSLVFSINIHGCKFPDPFNNWKGLGDAIQVIIMYIKRARGISTSGEVDPNIANNTLLEFKM